MAMSYWAELAASRLATEDKVGTQRSCIEELIGVKQSAAGPEVRMRSPVGRELSARSRKSVMDLNLPQMLVEFKWKRDSPHILNTFIGAHMHWERGEGRTVHRCSFKHPAETETEWMQTHITFLPSRTSWLVPHPNLKVQQSPMQVVTRRHHYGAGGGKQRGRQLHRTNDVAMAVRNEHEEGRRKMAQPGSQRAERARGGARTRWESGDVAAWGVSGKQCRAGALARKTKGEELDTKVKGRKDGGWSVVGGEKKWKPAAEQEHWKAKTHTESTELRYIRRRRAGSAYDEDDKTNGPLATPVNLSGVRTGNLADKYRGAGPVAEPRGWGSEHIHILSLGFFSVV
ncbi:hypothetical protein FB45DRAFT_867934 [Roridomyces roridus]|uniref:Uncharacterized protein n=1 Tax=Roridomyces roridus TaxID=1738132 RepID=A0AAD7FNJ2_9AGAR|nr:hypothetical protein FB45DRAFT_867934 [Roridomyces roridus]